MAWVQSPADHSLAVREQRVLVATLLGYKQPDAVLWSSWHSGKVDEQPYSTIVCLASRPVCRLQCFSARRVIFELLGYQGCWKLLLLLLTATVGRVSEQREQRRQQEDPH